MKKIILAIAMAIACSTVSANEILSEGFESGELIGWTVWKAMPNVKLQQSDAHSGEYSARFYKASGIERNIMLSPGKYMVTFYTKHVMGEGGTVAIKRKPQDNWKFFDVAKQDVPLTPEYTKSTINFKVKNEGLYKIVIQAPHTRQFVIDDILLEQIP
ncbi:MAG: hypothetical protein SNG35_06865 [Rikenellaceae bacterium]